MLLSRNEFLRMFNEKVLEFALQGDLMLVRPVSRATGDFLEIDNLGELYNLKDLLRKDKPRDEVVRLLEHERRKQPYFAKGQLPPPMATARDSYD